jgi:hypothetical protein
MTTSEFETDRRGLIAATLCALTIAGANLGAAAAPAAKTTATIRKALPPRGCYGIVVPGIKRTAFLNAPAGMSLLAFQDHWISTYGPGLRMRGARSIVFNLIDKEHSPEKRFDAVTEMVFDSDWAYEQEYLGPRTAYSEEAVHTTPAVVIIGRQIGIRDFDPGRPIPSVKRFGVLRKKPELNTDTLALTWRNDHAPLFAANDYLRRYYINLTDRTYAPDVPWDGYADIWWDDFASTTLHSDARVPLPDSDSEQVMYMFMTPTVVI